MSYGSEWAKNRREANPEEAARYWKNIKLKHRYGITLERYEQLFTQQGCVCAICGGEYTGDRSLQVDHDHHTSEVRGLLCWDCNTGIGKFEHDVKLLEQAIEYLKNPPVRMTI